MRLKAIKLQKIQGILITFFNSANHVFTGTIKETIAICTFSKVL